MDVLDFKEILTRKPWFQITPDRPIAERIVKDKNNAQDVYTDNALYTILTQEEMLRQYYPTGHKINSTIYYPNIYKKDPDTNTWYEQEITRCALGFQQIIATKHTIHLIGNDVQFELSDEEYRSKEKRLKERRKEVDFDEEFVDDYDDESSRLLSVLKKGWIELGMEERVFEAISSIMKTADGAVVGYFHNGKPGFKVLSFCNDDRLYPHYDSITGELELFARKYYDYDDDGKAVTEWVEIWDDKYMYRAKRGTGDNKTFIQKIKDVFGISGYEIVSKQLHGFNCVPVAYYREEDGPCWSNAQKSIEQFEEALSYFFENNKAFAFPILFVKGEGVELTGDANGAVKAISIDSADGDAGFLDHHDTSTSYNTLLTKFYDLIYEQSFTVKPPELKSGDLPGVALKLLYSPAIEKAISDAQKLSPFICKIVELVKFAWGYYMNCQASLINLGINVWIEPYVHQNDTELVTNLAQCVQNHFISEKTASERNTKYAKNDEYSRILLEKKRKMLLDVETRNRQITHSTDEEIRRDKVKSGFAGQDVNTGGGKQHINETDENGNRPGENNWEEFNRQRYA